MHNTEEEWFACRTSRTTGGALWASLAWKELDCVSCNWQQQVGSVWIALEERRCPQCPKCQQCIERTECICSQCSQCSQWVQCVQCAQQRAPAVPARISARSGAQVFTRISITPHALLVRQVLWPLASSSPSPSPLISSSPLSSPLLAFCLLFFQFSLHFFAIPPSTSTSTSTSLPSLSFAPSFLAFHTLHSMYNDSWSLSIRPFSLVIIFEFLSTMKHVPTHYNLSEFKCFDVVEAHWKEGYQGRAYQGLPHRSIPHHGQVFKRIQWEITILNKFSSIFSHWVKCSLAVFISV